MIETFELPTNSQRASRPSSAAWRAIRCACSWPQRPGSNTPRSRGYPEFLTPGDLVVVNTSATLAAAVDGQRDDGRDVTVHFSTALDDGTWLVEVAAPGARHRAGARRGTVGEQCACPSACQVTLLPPHADRRRVSGARTSRSRAACSPTWRGTAVRSRTPTCTGQLADLGVPDGVRARPGQC